MTIYGTNMGFNADATPENIAQAKAFGFRYFRTGKEVPWCLSDPTNHLSTLDLSGLAADIKRVHDAGLAVILGFGGCPTSLNPDAHNADGGWHYFPRATPLLTAAQARAAWASFARLMAALLDPAIDWIQIGNEIANVADFNKGDQSPAEVGNAIADCIDAVRAGSPTLRIIGPSLNPIGDINATPAPTHSMPVWGDAMLTAVPRLVGSSKPDLNAGHPYIWGDGKFDLDSSDPLSSHGWNGHVQCAAWHAVLLAHGCPTANAKLAITERGEPSTPAPGWDEPWQLYHLERDLQAIDNGIAAGVYSDQVEITHTLADISATIDAGHEFGILHHDLTVKGAAWLLVARAQRNIGGVVDPPPAVTPPALSGVELGAHFGVTVVGANPLDLDYLAASGCGWVRALWSNSSDPELLAPFIERAHALSIRVLVASQPATLTTGLDVALEAQRYHLIADQHPDALELGYRLNDPATNPALAADHRTDYVDQAAELALAAAATISGGGHHIPLLTASMAPVTTTSAQIAHHAIARLAHRYGRQLAAAGLRLGAIATTFAGGDPRDVTRKPAGNPCWHLRDARRTMKAGGWPVPIWITEIGRAQLTGEADGTYETAQTVALIEYIAAMNDHRTAGLPIAAIFWDRLRETTAGDGGLYKLDGNPRPVLATLTGALDTSWQI